MLGGDDEPTSPCRASPLVLAGLIVSGPLNRPGFGSVQLSNLSHNTRGSSPRAYACANLSWERMLGGPDLCQLHACGRAFFNGSLQFCRDLLKFAFTRTTLHSRCTIPTEVCTRPDVKFCRLLFCFVQRERFETQPLSLPFSIFHFPQATPAGNSFWNIFYKPLMFLIELL